MCSGAVLGYDWFWDIRRSKEASLSAEIGYSTAKAEFSRIPEVCGGQEGRLSLVLIGPKEEMK
jgi:hypothetical protein